MLAKLREFPNKVPSPSRDEMMVMLQNAMKSVTIDKSQAFKSLFVTNNLDGSEDWKVSDKLFGLLGKEMQQFRDQLKNEACPKTLNDLMKKITPPKGIKRKNHEGTELLDCEGEELELIEQTLELESIDENKDDPEAEIDLTTVASTSNSEKDSKVKSISASKFQPLSEVTNNSNIKKDAEFIESLHDILENPNTSPLLGPYVSALRVVHDNARKSIKKRIHNLKNRAQSENVEPEDDVEPENDVEPEEDVEPEDDVESDQLFDTEDVEVFDVSNDNIKPQVDEYWTVKAGGGSFVYAKIIIEFPLSVRYFSLSVKEKCHKLNDEVLPVLLQDLGKKISPPTIIKAGRLREYYHFV